MLNLRSMNWFTTMNFTNEKHIVNIPSLSDLAGIPREGNSSPLFIVSNVELSGYEYKSSGSISVALAGKNILLVCCANPNQEGFTNDQQVLIYNALTGRNLTYEQLSDDLFNLYIENYVQARFNDEKSRLEKEIAQWKNAVEDAKTKLLIYTDKIYQNECVLAVGFEGKYIEKIKHELSNIKNHKKCKELYFENGKLCIDTEYLYITEPITEKRFALGSCKLMFDLNRADVRIKNLTQTKPGYWDECQHPHVNNNGSPCLGNTAGQIAVYLGDNDIYACFLLMIGYLQTCDIKDSAGYYIGSWDEVDKDGNVISSAGGRKRGLESDGCFYDEDGDPFDEDEPEFIGTCHVCGESIYADNNYVTCYVCGEIVCEDCYINVEGEHICDDCRDNAVSICADCGETFLDDNGTFDDDGDFYCGSCLNKHEAELEEQAKAEVLIEDEEVVEDIEEEQPVARAIRQPAEITPENVVRCGICGQLGTEENMHNIGNGAYLCDVCNQQAEVN